MKSVRKTKPEGEYRKRITVTIDPNNAKIIYENFKKWQFRNVSHAVDSAIEMLIRKKLKGKD